MILPNLKLNRFIIVFLLIFFSCSKDNTVNNIIINEATQVIKNTSHLKSNNVAYLYNDIRDNDSIIGITYGLPVYEKDRYYVKKINNKVLLIEKNIYNRFFKNENLKFCNDPSYFRSKDYFPNIGEPYFVNIFIKNGKVQKIERQNIPEK
ncbi:MULTISPECIES: hypothetical protein [unclassified Chryseobacterium]|uniref:hypothetical protein n=1 Tax=unclassified Chryseobacterium TaxID=2593645 RepID=UPI00100C2261|nr:MULTISPECIES: hypothetical protein [unclassified Chryseobacterium]RXM50633.1 hypothetical protein BOQ64_18000 [Chryseobacterium sp. CH25]RXM63267.1 hypothetical protein BOQ60_18195 [Chryseobacterium sp. CH1]